ncbi:hypothetical protein NEMBOFW57_003367 [Staphylotrichum longicolle]|uniref:Restriction of telomere capping protein 4 n=1 Tax=Staphylotrichum longicolle TaxID=669026 RepID=A0AAD4F4U0_9PEZI|nr:hypothetical protein NEMBOFW57_003367 [Staphylotrichum longicolle]
MSPTRKFKQPPKESTPEAENPDRYKLKLPPSPSEVRGGLTSPARKFKDVGGGDFDLPANVSPVRKRRFKMPADDYPSLFGDGEDAEESQRPVFTIPDALPVSFIGGDDDKLDFFSSQRADTSNLLCGSLSSSQTEPELLNPTPVCPFCSKRVDQAHLDEFNANNPRMTVANMRRFCDQHKLRSAKETWVEKGYPDIDWCRLDDRIARHHAYIRRILQDGRPSHYGDLFSDAVRGGRNRTLLRSDMNLTPGYYGMRGLRHMTENLINEFAPVLRERAVEDRLIAARGHIMYLQSVLVPELAVRLVMEDMDVGEEEARAILSESVDVGELLNDEIADVVVQDSDDDEEEEET